MQQYGQLLVDADYELVSLQKAIYVFFYFDASKSHI